LATGCASIAFIASARKADKLKTYLLERGHDAARVAAIVAPAGIEIGAVTPEEIALSVLGGLVRARRGGAPAVTAEAAADPQQQAAAGGCCGGSATVAPAAATAIDPVCGMTVDIATADYRSRYDGRDYYFCCAGCQLSFDKEPQQFVSFAETARPAAEVRA
jgi:xanthine dehydrogenase accessory factor